ncbi:MAG: MBL fold metallo-hydrolase [Planctomycetota bacterium]
MRVQLLPSSTADPAQQFLTSFLIDERVAIDAGAIGFAGSIEEQRRIQDVFISHSHIDHMASLPVFLENTYSPTPDCVRVHGSRAVIECLRNDVFNNRLWPDFITLSKSCPPFLEVREIEAGKPLAVGGLMITPVEVNHVVPTHGFIVARGDAAVVFAGDTGPTDEIWRRATEVGRLCAVFLECSFPESLGWLADETRHLTPSRFARELAKLPTSVPVYAVHIKSFCRDEVIAELHALGDERIHICQPGKVYEFC